MFNAVGAHIYAGGFTVGVSQHFNVLAHLEHNGYGADVVKLNFPELPIYAGGPASWPKAWPRGAARPRLVFANPPCAIWSGAANGHTDAWRDDPRLQSHRDIFQYAMDVVEPDVLAIESVPPSFVKGREHVDSLIDKASTLGYSATVVMHNAKWLGVPQSRRRIFYVFHKVEIPWQHPPYDEPTTVRQALKKIVHKPGRGYDTTERIGIMMELLKHTPPGGGLVDTYNTMYPDPPRNARGQAIGRPAFLHIRAPWDKPAPVLIGGTLFHPEENRYFNQDELAALCSFPKTYKWPVGNSHDISNYMARGVMPKVGAWLAENVNRALEKNKRLNTTDASVLDVSKAPGAYYAL